MESSCDYWPGVGSGELASWESPQGIATSPKKLSLTSCSLDDSGQQAGRCSAEQLACCKVKTTC